MDESVGGRYSVWSSVGLSLQIALGADVWSRFLKGAAEMDAHFRDTPLDSNVPAKLAMFDVFRHSSKDNAPTTSRSRSVRGRTCRTTACSTSTRVSRSSSAKVCLSATVP